MYKLCVPAIIVLLQSCNEIFCFELFQIFLDENKVNTTEDSCKSLSSSDDLEVYNEDVWFLV